MIRGLLITDPAAGAARPTDDVDLIVDVPSYLAFTHLNEELRGLGFRESMEEGAPICRWVVAGVRTDIWYAGAMASPAVITGPDGDLRILDAPHYCATKLEAFAARGDGDYLHRDLEDFLAVVDGRPSLVDEIASAPAELRAFVAEGRLRFDGDSGLRRCFARAPRRRRRQPSAAPALGRTIEKDCRPAGTQGDQCSDESASPDPVARRPTCWSASPGSAVVHAGGVARLPIEQHSSGAPRRRDAGPHNRVSLRWDLRLCRSAGDDLPRPSRCLFRGSIPPSVDKRTLSVHQDPLAPTCCGRARLRFGDRLIGSPTSPGATPSASPPPPTSNPPRPAPGSTRQSGPAPPPAQCSPETS